MNSGQLDELRDLLARFTLASKSDVAIQHAKRTLNFIDGHARPWSRATLAGHLTASAWVLDRAGSHAALIHHRKLNRWLQPGGHIEDADVTWHAAAAREVLEETGLGRFLPYACEMELFDVDVHAIPARADEPAHHHYDLRFKFVTDVDSAMSPGLQTNRDEAHDCRWFRLEELTNDSTLDASMRRMIELTVRPLPE